MRICLEMLQLHNISRRTVLRATMNVNATMSCVGKEVTRDGDLTSSGRWRTYRRRLFLFRFLLSITQRHAGGCKTATDCRLAVCHLQPSGCRNALRTPVDGWSCTVRRTIGILMARLQHRTAHQLLDLYNQSTCGVRQSCGDY